MEGEDWLRTGKGGGNGPWSSKKCEEFLEYLRTC